MRYLLLTEASGPAVGLSHELGQGYLAQLTPGVSAHGVLIAVALLFLLLVMLLFIGEYLYGMRDLRRRRPFVHRLKEPFSARREAESRAEAFLQENVSHREYQQLLQRGFLEVPSSLYPGRTYRIPRRPGRIKVYESGRKVGELCIYARDPVPYPDLILTHKWMIEANERRFLSIANRIGQISL